MVGVSVHINKEQNHLFQSVLNGRQTQICLELIYLCTINFSSTGCKYTVHSQCANKNPEACARTFVKSKKEIGVRSTTTLLLSQNLTFICLYDWL